ncbi:cytochrome P450 4X1-like [Argonauta hians]
METFTSIINTYKTLAVALTWQIIFQICIIFLITWVLYSQFLKKYLSPLKYLPTATCYPILGSLYDIIGQEAGYFFEMSRQKLNASVFRYFWAYGKEGVCVADADIIKAVLVTKSKSFRKAPEAYRNIKQLLGDGLVTTEGKLHRRNRKICNGSFRKNILINMIPTFEFQTETLIKEWLKRIDKNDDVYTEIPIHEQVTNLTFDVIGKCAFDHEFHCITKEYDETIQLFTRLSEKLQIGWQIVLPDFFPFLHYLKTKSMKDSEKYIGNLNNIVYRIISEKRKIINQSPDDDDDSKVNNLLESLLYARDEETNETISDKEIHDHVITFMLAGHETTAVTITWVLLQLARFPHIQDKVREEIRSVIRDGSPITDDQLEQLQYLRCVIEETMRINPAVLMVARQPVEDCTIGDYFFPKGTFISVHISTLHRNPKYWKDPLEFRPERFSDPSKIYPYSFLPFVAGGRMCIGYKFAMMEMKTVLALLVNKFEFKPLPGIEYKRVVKVTSRPEPRLVLKVRKSM